MTTREKASYLTGLDHGFKMIAVFLELNCPAEELKDFGETSLLQFFQAMGMATLSEAEEAEFTEVLEELAEIVGSLLRPPPERN